MSAATICNRCTLRLIERDARAKGQEVRLEAKPLRVMPRGVQRSQSEYVAIGAE